jgi:copper chaperone CopZ
MKLRLLNLFLSLALLTLTAHAQGPLKWVDVGVNGLTCSLCSRSVEMSLSRLDFVDHVDMSLEKTEGRVFLKPDWPYNMKEISKAVQTAGFSVRFLRMMINFNEVPVDQKGIFTFQNQRYEWLDFSRELAKGDVAVKLVDEGFIPKKENVNWKKKIAALDGADTGNTFHVTKE